MEKNSSILRHLPNFLTAINILLGCIAINKAFERSFIISAQFIFAAAIIDFLDGFLARKLNATSEFGKALDSLADLVSFGIAPSFMIYQLLTMSLIMNNPEFNTETLSFVYMIVLYAGFLIPVFGALRLARFNTNSIDKKYFQGLPIPAAGILFASITLLFAQTENETIRNVIINTPFLLILIIIISLLMVSKLKIFSLKFENFSFSKENQLRYLFLSASVVLIVLLQYLGLPLAILLYIVLSIITGFAKK